MSWVPLALGLPVLAWTAWTDVTRMRIRNGPVLLVIAVWATTAPVIGWTEAGMRLAAGAVTLAVGLGLFALRLVGGGDAKMVPAVVLLVPTGTHALFALHFSAAMLAGLVAMGALRAVPAIRRSGAVALRARGMFPMGVAIAIAAALHLVAMIGLEARTWPAVAPLTAHMGGP